MMDKAWRSDFGRFWSSQAVSQIVSQSISITVPLLAITYLATPSNQIGILSALQYLPVLLITPVLGAYIDGLRRRPVMWMAHFGRAAIYGIATYLAITGELNTESLFVLVLAAGVLTSAFDVSLQTYIPNLVPRSELVWANSRIQGSLSFAQVIGPALGGLLVGFGTAWPPLALFTLGFCCAGCLFLRTSAHEQIAQNSSAQLSFKERLVAGLQIVWRMPTLRILLISSTWFNLFEQALITTFLVYATRSLNLSSSSVGMIIGSGAIGAMIVASLSVPLSFRFSVITLLIVFSGMASVAPALLLLMRGSDMTSVLIALLVFFLYGAGVTGYNIQAISLRQSVMPEGAQGKAGAAYRMFAYGALAAGGLLGSALISYLDVQGAMIMATTILILGWLAMIYVYKSLNNQQEKEKLDA